MTFQAANHVTCSPFPILVSVSSASLDRRYFLQLRFICFILTKIGSHQNLPEFAMVGHEEVQQLMDDHVIPDLFVELQQFGVEIKMALRGAGGPLVLHWPNAEPRYPDVEPGGPCENTLLEPNLRICSNHGSDPVRSFQQAEQVVDDALDPVKLL